MTDQVPTPFDDTVPAAPAAAPVAPVLDQVPAAPTFQIPEAVKGLVGEGMKYATPEAALESLPHAQHHIDNLEQEAVNMREELATRKSVEEVLKEINKTTPESGAEQQLTQEQMDALIDTRLATKEAQALAKSNADEVVKKFTEVFGDKDKAKEVYAQKAADLGLTMQEVNNLAATSPKAVFELYGIKPTEGLPPKIGSNINSEAVVSNNVQPVKQVSVMGASTHSKDIAAWNAAAEPE